MFTGIVEETGVVAGLEPRAGGARIQVECSLVTEGLREGDSVCVSGACLTAVEIRAGGFAADVSRETLERTTLGEARMGTLVNLERALPASGRLGGHIVQGHVDGVGVIRRFEERGGGDWWLEVEAPEEVAPYLVYKGSIAVDGISLTVARVDGPVFAVAVIPHTWRNTTLRSARPGRRVNLETDILAKYVAKLLERLEARPERLTVEKLRQLGY
ncbi:MAG: riboflavin synthase subunit alpha [Bryobacteraceae bacterium]|nr:MAG: riboflavin synthase subunit alpha [Bryobacteraceae bacterium]